MKNSRNNISTDLTESFVLALDAILAQACLTSNANSGSVPIIAIAFSGGLDSAVLLELAHDYAQQRAIRLIALHVHHGLQADADDWLAHCQQQATRRQIDFDCRRIHIGADQSQGIEHAARIGRYAALGEMCRQHGADLLLTAHHLDDQAETVMLQLLRGSGCAGLSAMQTLNHAPALLGAADLQIARPLLHLPRAALHAFATQRAIEFIDDPSNRDARYARNALRLNVMPALAQSFPGFQQRVARAAGHAQATQRLLVELAQQDFAQCALPQGVAATALDSALDLTQLKQLSVDRINNLLRYWFGSREIRMPSTAWLDELRQQLLEADADAQLCVTHPDCALRRYRNRVVITPRCADLSEIDATQFEWHGEPSIRFAGLHGVLYFEPAALGFDPDWLRLQRLTIGWRQGGERLRLAPNRPRRPLKQHYQQLGIPAWQRLRLPVVHAGAQLLFAAGVGMNGEAPLIETAAIGLRWQADD